MDIQGGVASFENGEQRRFLLNFASPSKFSQFGPRDGKVGLHGKSMVCWDNKWELHLLKKLLSLVLGQVIELSCKLSTAVTSTRNFPYSVQDLYPSLHCPCIGLRTGDSATRDLHQDKGLWYYN